MDLATRLTFVLCLLFWAQPILGTSTTAQKLLLISFDGFRSEYLHYYQLGNFTKFSQNGVQASDGMIAAFPTKTFPNHYALVTGLYPESHGVVDNFFYDSKLGENFNMVRSFESKWFEEAEPIWITAQSHGIKSGVYGWPGSTVPIHGKTANEFTLFNFSVPYRDRVDTVMEWFTKKNISLVALYFEQPDGMGHEFGAFSDRVTNILSVMDDTLGYIVSQLNAHGLTDATDIVIISDHGMTNISRDPKDSLLLDNYLSPDDYTSIPQVGPEASIYLPQEKVKIVYNKLHNAHPRVNVYLKENVPEHLHFRNNQRIAPIILLADENFTISFNSSTLSSFTIGQHGYDNRLNSMKPIFLAGGPSFKRGITLNSFQNVDVYPLMCRILGIQARPNNGSLNTFKDALTGAASAAQSSCIYLILTILLALSFAQSQF